MSSARLGETSRRMHTRSPRCPPRAESQGACAAKKTLLRLALPLAAVAAMVAPATASATSCPNANVSAGSVSGSTYNEAVLCLLNEQRTNNGLAPVVPNDELASLRLGHSSEMRVDSYFAHDSANGSSFSDRIAATGYLRGARRWVVGATSPGAR